MQVTPFLLKRVTELTGGASLAANIKLIRHNAAVGARIAVAYQASVRGHADAVQQASLSLP